MESTQYIDMDIHKDAISVAVMNSASKVVMESILETKAATILQFIYGLRGNLLVTLEEGTWAAWLYDLLKPYVTQVTVCNPRKNALLKSANKGDRIDARKLTELLRNGSLSAVYHGETDPPNAEGVVAQLSDAQQGSEASDESAQCAVPKLGHCLQRYASLRTPASVRMVEPDHRSRRALPSRIHLPTARWAAGVTPRSAAGSFGREPETWRDPIAAPDSGYRPDPGGSFSGAPSDRTPLSHEATTVGLQRPGDRDARQWGISLRGCPATTLGESGGATWSE
jgi:hypothetical protein